MVYSIVKTTVFFRANLETCTCQVYLCRFIRRVVGLSSLDSEVYCLMLRVCGNSVKDSGRQESILHDDKLCEPVSEQWNLQRFIKDSNHVLPGDDMLI